jgi:hypothetical protein
MKEKIFTIKTDRDIKKANKCQYPYIADFTQAKRIAILPNEFEFSHTHIFLCRPDMITIGDRAFANNTDLTNFGGYPQIIGDEAFSFCSNLKSFEFETVRSMGSGAFQYSGIREFNAGKDLRVLKDNTFSGCYNLTDVNLGQIEGIGHHCFASTGISSITLNKDLKKIGNQAFEACTFLKNIVCLCHEPPRLCESSLIGTSIEKIWLPDAESLEKYSTAKYWSDYKELMCLIDWNAIKLYVDHLKEERSKSKIF